MASLRLNPAADMAAARVRGVTRVANELRLKLPDADGRADEDLRGDVLSVETPTGGLVIVSGTVSSRAAHDHALAAAWSAPGVTQVDDRIQVHSSP